MAFKFPKLKSDPLFLAAGLTIIFTGIALGVYAYLGLFSRHLADDYCSVAFTRTNFLSALQYSYLNVSDRFTNFMFIALSEAVWPRSMSILPALLLLLWAAGIHRLLQQVSRAIGAGLGGHITISLALLLIFLVLLQAPNRYQILYWRSSMATHFAPLVLMPHLASFLLSSRSKMSEALPSRLFYPLCFLLAFMLGGFSEPVVVILITLLGCALAAAWLWDGTRVRNPTLNMLAWSLAGAVSTLLVMALAPANSLRLGDAPPPLPELVSRSFTYGFEFILTSFKSLPVPAFLTLWMPLVIFFSLYASPRSRLPRPSLKKILVMLAAAPVFSYVLIVASFSPSVYGQSFPVERARFAGQLCLVAALMLEGAGLGTLLAQWRPRGLGTLPLGAASALLLGIMAFYPLRAAWFTLGDAPAYRERARLWDARDAYIRRHAAAGEREIIIPGFSGIYGIKEVDEDANHWVNLCVAQYYRVDSVIAAAIPDEFIWEYLSE